MPIGAITQDIDAPQLLFAAFAVFFGGLVLYLRREDKREGYPLEDPAGGRELIGISKAPIAFPLRRLIAFPARRCALSAIRCLALSVPPPTHCARTSR